MKKQYRTDEPDWKTWRIDIYHDGTKITSETFLRIQDDEYNDRLDELEAQGYTYGYTVEEVKLGKKLYEHRLNNLITPAYLPPCCWSCGSKNLEPTKWDTETVSYKCLNCDSEWVRGNYPFEEENK